MSNPLYINFKNIADDLEYLGTKHKFIKSFGLGDTDQLSYWTQVRDNVDNPNFNSPIYPLLYVVPGKCQNNLRYKSWEVNLVSLDIVDRDLQNQVDVLSDTLQNLQDIISQYRLSVEEIYGCYNKDYFINESVSCEPFLESYSDLCNGWTGVLNILTTTPLDRCSAAFNTFTGTPITHDNINFKTFHDDFRLLADHHKQINSFGFGQYEQLSFWTESRLKEQNEGFNSAVFPLMYIVPSTSITEIQDNGSSWTEYEFNCIVMDILDRDLKNQVDVLSDTNQILDDIISQFRLSVKDSLGCFNSKYYLDDTIEMIPFMEKYTDMCGGWNAILKIKTMTPLDRCNAAFEPMIPITPTQTPSNTPTPSVTPTHTPTPTATSTCPITTQYLEVQLSDNTKFKLILWNNPNYTGSAIALCDYVISGCAFGDMGTIYCGEETIPSGSHQKQFDLKSVLMPGESVSAFTVNSYYTIGCQCPVNLILPTPQPTPSPTMTSTPTNTPTTTPTHTPTPSITPSATPPTFSGLTFLVASGLTKTDACQALSDGNTFTVYTRDLGNCAGCYGAGLNCWACLQADTPLQTFYLDQAFTQPIFLGLCYLTNVMTPSQPNGAYWTVNGGYPRGGPGFFGGC